jgi:hypothetical protein
MILDIVSTVGKNCITIEDGEQVYRLIHSELIQGHDVTLNFTGVDIFASPFFNAAVGQLLSDITSRQLQLHLLCIGLSEHGEHVMKRVMENAQKYYTNPNFRDSVDRVLAQQAQDL